MSIVFKKLYENLGYQFQNQDIVERALRHRSMGKISNERLEFLGDSILNFIIAAELFHTHPELREGDLSRVRANLVNGETLADLALELEIGEFLRFGFGESKNNTCCHKSIIADAMEAIIGAMYLDGGFEITRERVVAWFAKRLQIASAVIEKDPKTKLQELLQTLHLPLPTYTIVKIEGAAHAQIFHVECAVEGFAIKTLGIGQNKRRAERDAAENFLKASFTMDKL